MRSRVVLHTYAVLHVGFILASLGCEHSDCASAGKGGSGFGIVGPDTGKCSKAVRERCKADNVQVDASQADVAAQCSRRIGRGFKAEFTKIEITILDRKISVELITAKQLETPFTFVSGHRGDGDAT